MKALHEQCHILYEHTDQMMLLACVNRDMGATSDDDSSFPSKGEAVVTLMEKMYADRHMSDLEDILNDNSCHWYLDKMKMKMMVRMWTLILSLPMTMVDDEYPPASLIAFYDSKELNSE